MMHERALAGIESSHLGAISLSFASRPSLAIMSTSEKSSLPTLSGPR